MAFIISLLTIIVIIIQRKLHCLRAKQYQYLAQTKISHAPKPKRNKIFISGLEPSLKRHIKPVAQQHIQKDVSFHLSSPRLLMPEVVT